LLTQYHEAVTLHKYTMIKIFSKPTYKETVEELQEHTKHTWTYVESPTEKELESLATDLQLDIDLLNDAVDMQEVPRIERSDNAIYIFTKFVYITEDEQIKTAPMLLIVSDDKLISVSQIAFPRLAQFLTGKIHFTTKDRTGLLVNIFDQIKDTYNDYLNIISKKVGRLSINIEKIKNRDIVQFVQYENILNDLSFALIRINANYLQLLSGKVTRFTEEEKELINDIHVDNEQLLQITKESLRSIGSIREAYSTIMTNNLNKVIKLFTSLTVILTIPTIIGTFYGMNVPLPFADSPDAFITILTAALVASLIAIVLFSYQDWL
jgi:magnesium transporter